MKNSLKSSFLAVALAVGSTGGAQATEYDWGEHVLTPLVETSIGVGGGAVATGSFADTYLFSLSNPVGSESSAAVSLTLSGTSITGGTYALYLSPEDYTSTTPGGDSLVAGSWVFDTTSGGTQHTVVSLAAGNYYFKVTGTAGSQGGSYLLASSVNPVPEPEIYAMLAAGLGFMGFVARRRKAQIAAV